MNFRNIVISGDVGSGTSTLANNLADKLGWKYLSAGDIFRTYFKNNKIPLWDKNSIPDEMDKKVDLEFSGMLKNQEHLVFESHYGGWFAKDLTDVFKILLKCDRQVAIERILKRKHTHSETPEEIEKRRAGLYAKFKKLYSNDNYEDPRLFDLVIDTTNTSPGETLNSVLSELEK